MNDDLAFEHAILVHYGQEELCKTYSANFIDNMSCCIIVSAKRGFTDQKVAQHV